MEGIMKKRRLLCTIVLLVMTLVLVGCGGTKDPFAEFPAEGFLPATDDLFETSSEENGKNNHYYFIDAKVTGFDSYQTLALLEAEAPQGKIRLGKVISTFNWDKLKVGDEVRLYFAYYDKFAENELLGAYIGAIFADEVDAASIRTIEEEAEKHTEKTKVATFGDTIDFDDLEITFQPEYGFDVIENRYSDYNGNTVVKFPVTIKNNSNESKTLSFVYYKIYGAKGVSLSTSVGAYFRDALIISDKAQPGATQKTFIYVLYDGDGKYIVEFDNLSEKVTVELPIKQPK